MFRARVLTTVAASLFGLSCTWVQLSGEGEDVYLVANAEVTDCERLGNTKGRVPHELLFVPRRQASVDRELETLARNEGAKLGGNTITPTRDLAPGEREFAVYRCDD